MKTFSEQEVTEFLKLHLKDWSLRNNTINSDLKFKTFVIAFSFMTTVAHEAENLNHHPDWSNGYNKVSINLTTHTSNGITNPDFDLADKIDNTYKRYE